jgi:acyl-CoA thioesterase FadM
MPRYELPVTHRPERDGSPVASRHVPYYLAAEVFSDAWGRTLVELGPGVLVAKDVAVVSASFDFRREVFTGRVVVDVRVDHVGVSSIRFALALEQDGQLVATGSTTVAQTDADRTRAVPLTDIQRAALAAVSDAGG